MKPVTATTLLFERLSRLVHNDAHTHGLKPTQWEALRYISRANRFSKTPKALTRYLGITKGTVSQTLLALEKKGLIRKAADKTDKRAVHVSLTKKGQSLLRKDPLHAFDHACQQDSNNDLTSRLENILRKMIEARGGQPFGQCKTCAHFQTNRPGGKPFFCALLSAPLSTSDSEKICVEQC